MPGKKRKVLLILGAFVAIFWAHSYYERIASTEPAVQVSLLQRVDITRGYISGSVTELAANSKFETENGIVEDSGYMRYIAVTLESDNVQRIALLPTNCAIPKPGDLVTLQIVEFNAQHRIIGNKIHDSNDYDLIVVCPKP
jgi:hypothetical protein